MNGPDAPAAPAASDLDALPIASYLGSDDQLGQRVHELLAAEGIESSAGGSLGYSVWISGSQRSQARAILLAAAASECLAIAVYDDQGATVATTPAPRCASPTPVPHASGAK